MPQLKKQTVFRLRRSLFHWDKSYDAPFVKLVHQKLFNYIENKFPYIYWKEEFRKAREDFSHVETWGDLPLGIKGQEILIKTEGIDISIMLSKLFWCLIYPDYLLITYPVLPPGKQKTSEHATKKFANPRYHRPSRYWHLPDHVYAYFDSVYGERNIEEITPHGYPNYIKKRTEYCEYFARKYKLPVNHFAQVTGSRVKVQERDLTQILSIN